MFVYKKNYQNAIQSTRVYIGDLLGCETKEEAYIDLKEMKTSLVLEMKKAQEKGDDEVVLFFQKMLPEIILSHNLYEDDDKKMSNQDVTNLVFDKIELAMRVIHEYSQMSFFHLGKKKESK